MRPADVRSPDVRRRVWRWLGHAALYTGSGMVALAAAGVVSLLAQGQTAKLIVWMASLIVLTVAAGITVGALQVSVARRKALRKRAPLAEDCAAPAGRNSTGPGTHRTRQPSQRPSGGRSDRSAIAVDHPTHAQFPTR